MLEFSLKSIVSIAIKSSRITNSGDIEDELSNGESRLSLAELLVELSLILAELLLVDNRLNIFLIEKELKSKFLRD